MVWLMQAWRAHCGLWPQDTFTKIVMLLLVMPKMPFPKKEIAPQYQVRMMDLGKEGGL